MGRTQAHTVSQRIAVNVVWSYFTIDSSFYEDMISKNFEHVLSEQIKFGLLHF